MSPSAATCCALVWRLRAKPRRSLSPPGIEWRFFAPAPAPSERQNAATLDSMVALLSERLQWHALAAAAAEFPNPEFAPQEFVALEFQPRNSVKESFAVAALELAVLASAHSDALCSHQI